jgi:hypothetical protein
MRWAYDSTTTKKSLKKAGETFSMGLHKIDGGITTTDMPNTDGLTPIISVSCLMPPSLKTRISKDENGVNLLKIATIIYNDGLSNNPGIGFGKTVVVLGDEKLEYDYRIHSVSFEPTIDLENLDLVADVSTTDNDMVKRLMEDEVLHFYITGKLIENDGKHIDNITITKIISHVDQSVYAKKFGKIKDLNPSVEDKDIKEELFNNPEWKNVNIEKMSKVRESVSDTLKSIENPKNIFSFFKKFKFN